MTGPVQAPITAGPFTTTTFGVLAGLSLTAALIRALHKTVKRWHHDTAWQGPPSMHLVGATQGREHQTCIACLRRQNTPTPSVTTLDGYPLCAAHATDYLTTDL